MALDAEVRLQAENGAIMAYATSIDHLPVHLPKSWCFPIPGCYITEIDVNGDARLIMLRGRMKDA